MTELQLLRRRRSLVLLSAELQRATLARRLASIDANPLHHALRFAATAVKRSAPWRMGVAALALAVRAWRRRSARHARRELAT